MKHWIKDRLTLNREGGIDEIYYPTFDADAIYFEDPAGNSVELIGRRKRDLFGSLTKEAFLNISEIGITTPFVTEVGEQLQEDRKSTRLNSSHVAISYAVFCWKNKKK